MSSAQWLTLEDWLNCKLPLCPLLIRNQGDVNSVGTDHIVLCSTRNRIGSTVLSDGNSLVMTTNAIYACNVMVKYLNTLVFYLLYKLNYLLWLDNFCHVL